MLLMAKQAAMEAFARRFYTLKDVPGAFDNSVAENYIQHNARILSERGNLIEALSALFASADNTFDIKRLIVDRDTIGNDIVVMHLEATNASATLHRRLLLWTCIDCKALALSSTGMSCKRVRRLR